MGMNAHRAFFSAAHEDHYLAALTVDERQNQSLRNAREEIREALRQGLRSWDQFVSPGLLFEDRALASVQKAEDAPPLRPKFRMQGSFAYHTLNRTTQHPPQEIDLDDGMFLPVSFLSQDGAIQPAVASEGYFAVVESILRPLCKRRGWTLITDKASCIRVVLSLESHVDLALYAIPDDEFEVLVEKSLTADARRSSAFDEALTFSEDMYSGLPADQMMLAHREEGWKPSDPRKLEEWFQSAVKQHGQQLRRVCRYLKGWRDHNWPSSRLSSIALMSCVITSYDEAVQAANDNRDDNALLMVAANLPDLLAGRIANPVVDGQYLDEGWSPEARADFVAKAADLHRRLRSALGRSNDSRGALIDIAAVFGAYIPDDHELIVSDGVSVPAILTTGLLKDLAMDVDAREAVDKGGDDRFG